MRALQNVRNAPVRLAARLSSAGADDAGMTTAEYAVGTVAACGFGGVLVEVIKDPGVQNAIKSLFLKALSFAGLG